MIQAANVQAGDTVLEVGPGKGVLTHALLQTGAQVIAVEKDRELIEKLKQRFQKYIQNGQLTLEQADIRDFDPNKLKPNTYKLAANIPYYLTSDLIRQFLTAKNQPQSITVLVQKEVADRVVAKDDKESVLSLSVKAYGAPELVAAVPAEAFSPPPEVSSTILHISDINRDFFRGVEESEFFQLIKTGFIHKRKTLANNLAKTYEKSAIINALTEIGPTENIRPEKLTSADWKQLLRYLKPNT
jgi:16S rRNA (adenine1518-N6/adenine1519-N6)-dimethyltransferase